MLLPVFSALNSCHCHKSYRPESIPQQSDTMPKNMNTSKAAAAVFQNEKAIQSAKKTGGLFGAVTKALGSRGFQIHVRVPVKGSPDRDMLIQATPRKLFQGGQKAPIRIAVGHVVLLAGDLRLAGVQRPLEIVGRLDSRAEIQELVKSGLMPAAILGIAESAGAVETSKPAEDDIFESDDSDEDFWTAGLREVKGGLKAQRKAAETVASISARVSTLKRANVTGAQRVKGVDGSLGMGDMADPALFNDPDYETFSRWRSHKAKAVTMSGGGSVAPTLQPVVETAAELMALFRLERETARLAAEQAAIVAEAEAGARGAAVRAEFAGQAVKDNWDDEEDSVLMEDL